MNTEICVQSILFFLFCFLNKINGFVAPYESSMPKLALALSDENSDKSLREEASDLLSKAQKIRSEIDANQEKRLRIGSNEELPAETALSPWAVTSEEDGDDYRLYVDIGREEGTWMDRRWGASGRRITFTIDVRFSRLQATPDQAEKMVKDNFGGTSSKPSVVFAADFARLRDGFERMGCEGGCYRIDSAKGKDTLRFYLSVEGTKEDMGYGDISIPNAPLYFSIPCFGRQTSMLSTKDGPVTVRQVGWNTGWRREESRIVGTFSCRPIDEAQPRDGF